MQGPLPFFLLPISSPQKATNPLIYWHNPKPEPLPFPLSPSSLPIPRKQRKTYHFQHIRKESPAAALHYLRHSHSRTSSFLSPPFILSNSLKVPKTLAFSAYLKEKYLLPGSIFMIRSSSFLSPSSIPSKVLKVAKTLAFYVYMSSLSFFFH